jgi:tetratricopeptide (TPR) repeat protein
MSKYLDESDSDDGGEVKVMDEATRTEAINAMNLLKEDGNNKFKEGDYEEALKSYTEGVNALKSAGFKKEMEMSVILLNRSAAYLALKRYVPALYDANVAGEIDTDNWKAFWRQGVALMSMAKKSFRCKQALEAFNKCMGCSNLPEAKKKDIADYVRKAKRTLEEIDENTPMPDMSNCMPS